MAAADHSRALGSRCGVEANRVAASRRLWHTRSTCHASLSQAASNVNNQKQYRVKLFAQNALRRKFRNRQSFRLFAGPALFRIGRCHSAAPLFGLCWPVLACIRRRRQARLAVGSRPAWAGGLLANQPTVSSPNQAAQ